MEIIKMTGMMIGENVSPVYEFTTCGMSSVNIECPCKSMKFSKPEEKTYTTGTGETMKYKTFSISDKYDNPLSFDSRLNSANNFEKFHKMLGDKINNQ